MKTPWPTGLVTALVTPLRNDAIDKEALAKLIAYQLENGASGFVVSGGTGEYGSLSIDERSDLIRAAVEIVGGRVPVIGATACLSTRDTVRLSLAAAEAGVTGLLLASSYGEPISWREKCAFYEEVDASLATPILIYNTPPAGLLTFDQIRQLAQLEHVTGIKDSSGNPELMGDLLAWAKTADFAVYVGKDSFLYEAISTGARGAVFGTANFMPAQLASLIKVLQQDKAGPAALEQWTKIRPLLRVMESASNYVGLCKIGCKLRGIDVGSVRRPYLMPEESEITLLKEALHEWD